MYCWTLVEAMVSLSTCHLGVWIGWQILLNLVKSKHLSKLYRLELLNIFFQAFFITKVSQLWNNFSCSPLFRSSVFTSFLQYDMVSTLVYVYTTRYYQKKPSSDCHDNNIKKPLSQKYPSMPWYLVLQVISSRNCDL